MGFASTWRRRRWARVAAWAAWTVTVASYFTTFADGPPSGASILGALLVFPVFLVFPTVGLVVATRQPRNALGWVLLAAATMSGPSWVISGYAEHLTPSGRHLPGATVAALLSVVTGTVGVWLVLTLPLLLFPDGRLLSRRWRPVVWAACAGITLMVSGILLTPGILEGSTLENPLEGSLALSGLLSAVGVFLVFGTIAAALASVVLRWRRARGAGRQQLKWLFVAGCLVIAGLAGADRLQRASPLGEHIFFIVLALPAVAVGIGILRHRLYDIDLLINRTLIYGALTATLGLAYAGIVLGLGQLLGSQGSNLAVAVATLAVAAAFRPVRRRIQHAVDRYFNRHKYDAALTIEAFSARLRQHVDLDSLSAELLAVVRQTMQPTAASLWLRRGLADRADNILPSRSP